jgi:hypothetical protein
MAEQYGQVDVAGLAYARLGDPRALAMANLCNKRGLRSMGDSIELAFYTRKVAISTIDSMKEAATSPPALAGAEGER